MPCNWRKIMKDEELESLLSILDGAGAAQNEKIEEQQGQEVRLTKRTQYATHKTAALGLDYLQQKQSMCYSSSYLSTPAISSAISPNNAHETKKQSHTAPTVNQKPSIFIISGQKKYIPPNNNKNNVLVQPISHKYRYITQTN